MTTAKIVSLTQPLIEGIVSAQDFIAYTARVSNPGNQMNTDSSENLLKYCFRNKHFSVFEMVTVVMSIDTTRDIARQILRHRSFSFQEYSQRYSDPTMTLGFDFREARLQDTKNRQNSIEITDTQDDIAHKWIELQGTVLDAARHAYKKAIDMGIAKEQARAVLPEGMTRSRLYMSGTLRSWIHYCELRCANGTQKEHRQVADDCREQLTQHFPFLTTLW
jgi:thymidylate synthase (FAD)